MGACGDLRVLELAEGFGAATLCGQLFAGLGASVIKLERTGGEPLRAAAPLAADGTSCAFHLTNAGKESAELPAAAAAAERRWNELVGWADIVVVGDNAPYRPAPAAELSKQWPGKVICSISTFGSRGVRAAWQGNGLIAEAMGGLMACTGYPERPPVQSGVPYAAHVAAMFAFSGIMAAVWERRRSGLGQYLDLSIVDCLIALLGNFIPGYFLSGRAPKRIGNRHTIAAPWNLYPASDGAVVICTGTGGASWWKIITDAIGRTDLANDERFDVEAKRVQNVDQVDAIVGEWTRQRSMAEVVARMTERGIPASEIASVEAVIADRHYAGTRAMINEVIVGTVAAPIKIPGLPLKIGAWAPPLKAAPALNAYSTASPSPPQSAAPPQEVGGSPLRGIRILEFASRTSVPMAARMLCDLGAEIVKIEPRKGESLRTAGQRIGGSSYLFHINNAGKRSIVIEPKDPRGRELMLQLAAQADVWMENLAPGTLESMGLGFADLRAVNPKIIYCSVSGFGLKSDYGRKKALDTVVQAASGVMYLTGYPDHFPVKLGISAVDLAAAVGLVGGVLAALYARRKSGEARHLDLAMADVGVWMTQSLWPQIFSATGHPTRLGNRNAAAAPHNTFAAKDGFLAVAVERDEQWARLVKLLQRADLADASLATAAGRLQQIERVEAAISEWSGGRAAAAAAEVLQANGVPAAPVRSLPELVQDPEVAERGLVVDVDHPVAGRMRLLGSPFRLSRTPARIARYAPMLGEHTRDILSEWLNLADAKIDALEAQGVIATATAKAPEKTAQLG